ncbi:MAG: hypothetical protein ABI895_42685, partial [Deltaproteobacteria bacterium]
MSSHSLVVTPAAPRGATDETNAATLVAPTRGPGRFRTPPYVPPRYRAAHDEPPAIEIDITPA